LVEWGKKKGNWIEVDNEARLNFFCYLEREDPTVNDENVDHENYFSETYYLYQISIGRKSVCLLRKISTLFIKGIKKNLNLLEKS